jgi:DNA-directed RNA polymerase subunit M/transcription elongation factor TFIIS
VITIGETADIVLVETSQLFDTDYDDQRSQELRYLVEQTQAVVSVQREEIGDASSDDSYGTDEDGRLDDHDASDVVQELKSQICYLVELGPTLQQNVLYARKARTGSSFPPLVPFHLSDPAKVYVSLIREKYRTAEDQLVDRLGESNWQRHKMVRERMDTTKSYPGRADGHVEEIPAIEDRNDLYSAFRPYSAFHDSGIGTSVPAHTIYAPSHTSFQSTNFEGDQGSVRVPSTPEEVSAGKPFQCPLCGDLLTNVRNRIEWKSVSVDLLTYGIGLIFVNSRMHVFADLRPYICTFANCEKELAQFTTREAWANHELMDHRILRSWACPECAKPCNSELAWVHHLEGSHQQTFTGPKKQIAQKLALTTQAKPIESEACPLCGVISGMSRREFVKHLGRHMEEIALMALPRDHDEESEADSANTESDEADTSVKNVFTACEPSCGKCGRTRITNAQGETGSAGELKSVFCQCADGGHEWKVSRGFLLRAGGLH